jgi:hypothetical protein
MATLRDRLTGHFLPRAQAAEGTAPTGPTVEDLQVEDDFALPATPQTFAELRAQIAGLNAQRQDLLAAGDIAAVAAADDEIRHLEIVGESLEVRRRAAEVAHAEAAQNRRVAAWQALRSRFEAARARRDKAAYELWVAVDDVVAAEAEAESLGVSLGDERTPADSVITRYMLRRWAEAHARRIGLMPQRAA